MKPILNIDDVEMRDFGNGQGFDARIGSFGEKIGSTGMGVMLHEVEPGKKAFPFHNHHKIEAVFKAFARAMRQAVSRGLGEAIPSTKGTLED